MNDEVPKSFALVVGHVCGVIAVGMVALSAFAIWTLVERLGATGVIGDPEALRARIAEGRGEDLVVQSGRAFIAHYRTETAQELGIAIGQEKHLLSIGRSGIKHTADKLGRSYLHLTREAATRLLLGKLNFNSALENETVRASTQAAREIGAVLFPTVPWWISQWDELTAI